MDACQFQCGFMENRDFVRALLAAGCLTFVIWIVWFLWNRK